MNCQPENHLKKSCTVFFVFTTLLLGILGSLLLFLPQHTFSENENRYLTTFHPVSLSGFIDRSVQENLDNSSNDQFFGRDFWIKFATVLQCLIGFQDAGGVYFGKNGYYFERILDSDIPEKKFEHNLRYLEQFAAKQKVETVFLPVPSAGTILKDDLPKHAVLYDDSQLFQQAGEILLHAKLLDLRPALINASRFGQIYFKTDHHWSIEGAYQAYAAICKMHDISPKKLSAFVPECVSNTFYGTLYSKAPTFHVQPDQLIIPKNVSDVQVAIDMKKTHGLYHLDQLETKDKYSVYFGGNYGRIDIQATLQSHTDAKSPKKASKRLLLLKDSFANSLIPFLTEYYDEIVMLDLRYYNGSLTELLQTELPTEILVLYELSNFAQDMNFFKILK